MIYMGNQCRSHSDYDCHNEQSGNQLHANEAIKQSTANQLWIEDTDDTCLQNPVVRFHVPSIHQNDSLVQSEILCFHIY